MYEIIRRVLTNRFVSVVVQVKCFVGLNVPQCTEDQPCNAFVAKLQRLDVLQFRSVFLRVVDTGDKDGDVGESAGRYVQTIVRTRVSDQSEDAVIVEHIK